MSDRRQRELHRAAQAGDPDAELAYLRDRRDRTQDATAEELGRLSWLELELARSIERNLEWGSGSGPRNLEWGGDRDQADRLFVQAHRTMRQALRLDPLNVDLIVLMFSVQYALMEEGFMTFPAVRTTVNFHDAESWVVNTIAVEALHGSVYRPPYSFERMETAIWAIGEDGERDEDTFEIVADAFVSAQREAAEQHVKTVQELAESAGDFAGLLSSGFEEDPIHYLTWRSRG